MAQGAMLTHSGRSRPGILEGVLAMIAVQEKIDVLKMARDFIQEPGAWVKGSHAQDDRGEEIAPEEPDAVCFCLEGAIIRALTELGESAESSELLEMDAELMGDDGEYMTMWQDRAERTHAEVLARVDATLERLEREAIASFGRA